MRDVPGAAGRVQVLLGSCVYQQIGAFAGQRRGGSEMPTEQQAPSHKLGTHMRRIRLRQGWTLTEMSDNTGIPVSTLSKIERNQLSLSYDKLVALSRRLEVPLSEFFGDTESVGRSRVTARRSMVDADQSLHVTTDNHDYYYLCTELRDKRMIPAIVHLRARTLEEFGPLVRHDGEELIYILEGAAEIHTEFYDPVVLHKGQGLYIDAQMGHATLLAEGYDSTVLLSVSTGAHQGALQHGLMAVSRSRGVAGSC